MKILLFQRDIFCHTGGGETVYKYIISSMPGVQFFYFIDKEKIDMSRPCNAYPILLECCEGEDSLFYWESMLRKYPNLNDGFFKNRLSTLLDSVVSLLAHMSFDIIDIPDFILVGDFIRPLLQKYCVKYKKIVIAAHGRVSSALELEWEEQGVVNLELLEQNQIKTADAVYGISERYLHRIVNSENIDFFTLDPIKIVHKTITKSIGKEKKPDIFYIARKPRHKGPDLFVEISRWIDPTLYSSFFLCGPDITVKNGNSNSYLKNIIDNRDSTVYIQNTLDKNEIEKIYADKSLILIPSRYETFNLVALEALLSGCPVAISEGAGVCDFLDRYYPEIPYIKIKLDNFYECIKEIEFVLEHYDTYRAQLSTSLQKVKSRQTGSSIDKIYTSILALPDRCVKFSTPDEVSFGTDLSYSRGDSQSSTSSYEIIAQLVRDWYRMPENSASACESKIQALYSVLSECNVIKLYADHNRMEKIPYPDLPEFFNGSFFSCSLWHELARLLRISGKEQLAVMFELRAMRNLGYDHFGVLPKLCASLLRQGFPEEAHVAELMFSQEPESVKVDKIYTFLQQRCSCFFETTEPEYSRIEDARYIAAPKVSVIVSLYNAAPKLRQFLTCLSLQTMVKRHEVELILEDSCSPADEWSVVQEFLTSSPLSIFYGRSPSRETVQCAWNRGIKVARAPYLVLLGVDEMLYPDALDRLYEELQLNDNLDWVVANAVQTEVDQHGLLVRDILKNDFHGGSTDVCVNDKKYIRWNASMYRKNLHDKFGYYDPTFFCTGNVEFQYRILPYISVAYIDKTLGVYWDYPEIRVSSPFIHEIAMLRAWFIFRTHGGAMYLLQNKSEQQIINYIRLSLKHRRCVCRHFSTDISYAASLARILKNEREDSQYKQVADKVLELDSVLRSSLLLPNVVSSQSLRQTVDKVFTSVKEIAAYLSRELGVDLEFPLFNDFLHERFSFFGIDRSGKENISLIS